MLTCEACGAGGDGETGPLFERREYVRQQTMVDRHDEPATPDGPVMGDPLGAERTYQCLSCGGHDVEWRRA